MYQICVRSTLTERLAAALEGMTLHAGAVNTVSTGEIRDQSQLYGLLDWPRDLDLELISMQPQTEAGRATDEDQTEGALSSERNATLAPLLVQTLICQEIGPVTEISTAVTGFFFNELTKASSYREWRRPVGQAQTTTLRKDL